MPKYILNKTGDEVAQSLINADNALLTTTQSLTDTQKTQAKSNLGISTIVSDVQLNNTTIVSNGVANLTLDSTLDSGSNNPVYNSAVATKISEVESIAKGANQAVSASNYSIFISACMEETSSKYKIGQSVYIVTREVPDLWISGINAEKVSYTYRDDESFIRDIKESSQGLRVGFYKIALLETEKVDLTNYVTLTGAQTITGAKTFAGDVSLPSGTLMSGQPIETTNNKLSAMPTNPDNTSYLGALAVKNLVDGCEKTSNKISVISAGATQSEYPSGSAVVGYVTNQIAPLYTKPASGIPSSDLDATVRSSLAKADTALQSVSWGDIGGSLSSQTDLQTALNGKQSAGKLTINGTLFTVSSKQMVVTYGDGTTETINMVTV